MKRTTLLALTLLLSISASGGTSFLSASANLSKSRTSIAISSLVLNPRIQDICVLLRGNVKTKLTNHKAETTAPSFFKMIDGTLSRSAVSKHQPLANITINNSPQDITIECDESTDPSNTGNLTASTSCTSGGLMINYNDVTDGNTCPETITRTWTATDNCGNSEDYVQLITIQDTQDPSADPMPQVTVACISQVPATDIADVTGENDNCTNNLNISHVSDVSDGLFCPETITRTYSVEDQCGNFIHLEQTIIVNDESEPVIDCTISQDTIASGNGQLGDYTTNANATDNCTANPLISQSPAEGSSLSPGSNSVTLTATDDCGNTDTCTIEVVYDSALGLPENDVSPISVFPNPIKNSFYLDFGQVVDRAEIILFDINGRCLITREVFNTATTSFPANHLKKGFYTVAVKVNGVQTVHKLSKE
ncbi:MAG: T9SS type A sorting domain-containing protein [Bacteroidota bacterium]